MPEGNTEEGEKEADDGEQVLQRWKLVIIGVLAVPSFLFAADTATGLGRAVGSALGMAVIFYIATLVARRTGISGWFQSRTWIAMAVVSAIPGFVVAAEPNSMAFHGFGAAFLYLLIAGLVLKGLRKVGSKAVNTVR